MDGNDFFGVQGGKRISAYHHVIRSSRFIKHILGLRSSFHENMSSFLLGIPILVIFLSNSLQNIDIVFLEKRGEIIKFLLHIVMFRVEALPVVGTLDFLLSLMAFILVFL